MPEQEAAARREGFSQWFVIIVAVFVTCLLTANITAVKLIDVLGFVLPAGVLIFPISYIAGDVLTEVYGFRQARRVIWLGFFCNLLAVLAIWLGGLLPTGDGGRRNRMSWVPWSSRERHST